MDLPDDIDALEQRWLQLFNEFQDFRARRIARKTAAIDELETAQKEIDVEISNIQNEKIQSTEAIRGEAEARIHLIEEQIHVEIQRLQDEADKKTTEIQRGVKKDVELLQAISEKKAQELEDKRLARKRKHEEDDQEIETEFATGLKALERSRMPSVCTASRTTRGARERTLTDYLRHYRKRHHPPQR